MKKKILFSIIMLCILLCCASIVNANNTGKVEFVASSLSVKPGDTFTVKISAKCEDGINGIATTYSYDKDKLELISAKVANDNWVSMGVNNAIEIMCNTTSKITSDDIYILTFKAKSNITEKTTANVGINSIKVDSDVNASTFVENEKTLKISIVPLNTDSDDKDNDKNDNENQGGNSNSGGTSSNNNQSSGSSNSGGNSGSNNQNGSNHSSGGSNSNNNQAGNSSSNETVGNNTQSQNNTNSNTLNVDNSVSNQNLNSNTNNVIPNLGEENESHINMIIIPIAVVIAIFALVVGIKLILINKKSKHM